MELIKTAQQGLLRDTDTKALINTNMSEYEHILEKRRQAKQLQTVQQQIDGLKSEFSELKNMIIQLINGRA
jgi:hypothetical protein